jgi:hypothetical protein
MTKQQAIDIFGRQIDLAAALQISRSAVAQWPETLTTRQADQVLGAALRLGKLPAAPQPDKAA